MLYLYPLIGIFAHINYSIKGVQLAIYIKFCRVEIKQVDILLQLSRSKKQGKIQKKK